MNALSDYLSHVLPWGDDDFKSILTYYTDRATGQDMPMHVGVKDIAEAEKAIRYYSAKGKTVYIAVQSHKFPDAIPRVAGSGWYKKANRSAKTCHLIQVFITDIDFKDGWGDAATATAGIQAFCVAVGIPSPTLIVHTGGGIHCYWRIDVPLTPAQWASISSCFAEAQKQHGVPADHVVTCDTARILRPPETFNYKYTPPRPVLMTQPGPEIPLQAFAQPLLKYAPAGPHLAVVNRPAGIQSSGLAGNFTAGVGGQSQPVDLYDAANAGCGIFFDAYNTNGALDDGKVPSQGLWNLIALACTFDLTPDETFEELSDGYPNYDPAAGAQMLARKQGERASNPAMGWPSCKAFSVVSTHCMKCAHLPKNQSPLHLASAAQKQAAQPAAAQAGDLPPGYFRHATTGIIMTNKSVAKKPGVIASVVALEYEAKEAVLNNGNELEFMVNLRAGGGWARIIVPLEHGKTDAITGHLNMQGVYITQDTMRTECRNFIMAWAQHIRNNAGVTGHKYLYGWSGKSFAYGGKIYSPTGAEPINLPTLPGMMPKGDLKPWKDAIDMQTAQKRPAIDCLLAAGPAAALVYLSGADTTMLAAVGESGVGKTTALKSTTAMYGHPVSTRRSLVDTENSLMKFASTVRHLPVIYDEIKTSEDSDKLVRIAFQLTQNKEKARLSANSTPMDIGTFATLLIAGSNTSIADVVTAKTKTTTAGAVRIFEITVPPAPKTMSTAQADMLMQQLEENYGRAGEVFIEWLVKNRDAVIKKLEATALYFEARLQPKAEERFWVNTLRLLVVGAECMNQALGTKLDVQGIATFLEGELAEMRGNRDSAVVVVTDLSSLAEFVHTMAASQRGVALIETAAIAGVGSPGGGQINLLSEVTVKMTSPWMQWGKTENMLRVKQREFRDWCRDNKHDYKHILAEGRRFGVFTDNPSGRIGTGVTGMSFVEKARCRCIDIDCNALGLT